MVYSRLTDFGVGAMVFLMNSVVPICLLIPIILVEQFIFIGWLGKRNSWRNTTIINLVSTVVGYFDLSVGLTPTAFFHRWAYGYFSEDVILYGKPPDLFAHYVVLNIVAMWLSSVIIEGITLMVLEREQRPPFLKLWLATLVANTGSYMTMVALIYAWWTSMS